MPWEAGFTFALREYEPPLRPRRPELPPVVAGRENAVDRILDAYLDKHTVSAPGTTRMMRRSCGAFISTSSACCRRPNSCTNFSPGRSGQATSRRSTSCSPTTAPTPNIGSRSGTTCCETTTGHRLHRRRPQADQRVAVSRAARQQAVRRVRARADRAVARIGRFHQRASSGAAT